MTNQFSKALLVVAKRPAPGQTKTRLTPYLSPEKAAALYECFLKDTIALMRKVQAVQPVLAYLPAGEEPYFRLLAPDFELILQDGDDLGPRLDNATMDYLERGFQQVVIMDSDSPTLPVEYLEEAYLVLDEEVDLVLGPCDDGGYYLIGMKQPVPRLLREVQMSTPHVVAQTLELAAQEGLKTHLLPRWYDVDSADELARLKLELAMSADIFAKDSIAVHTRSFLEQYT
jgi:rSAM/selenodomain-associated transferase 1